MNKVVFQKVEDFIEREGCQLGVSDWFVVSQEVINHFAGATQDYQWIHVDVNRAQIESPYGTTIAHGYLTLSLLPHLLDEIIEVKNLKHLVNYSVEKMVFKNIVPAGSKIRLTASLKSAKDLGNIVKANIQCVFEIEGQDKPALEGSVIYLYYF